MGVPIDTMLSAFRGTVALRRCAPVAIDWGAIAAKVTTDSGKAELGMLRAEITEINKALDSVPDGVASVDFGYWKQKIQTPGAVEQFESAFNALQTPTLQDTFTSELSSRFESAIAAAEVQAAASEARIEELKAELESLAVAKAELYNKTVDESLAENPELEAEIEAEIADNYWK